MLLWTVKEINQTDQDGERAAVLERLMGEDMWNIEVAVSLAGKIAATKALSEEHAQRMERRVGQRGWSGMSNTKQ